MLYYMMNLGVRLRSFTISLIFTKTLKLSKSLTNNIGVVVNLITNDAQRWVE